MSDHHLPQSIQRLIAEFSRLPGIGNKTAQRLAFYMLKQPEMRGEEFGDAVKNLKKGLYFCTTCQNLAESETCLICQNTHRDERIVCIVEEVLDLLALESTNAFRGRYHVLHGVLSPIEGVGPENLRIKEFVLRLEQGNIDEVILALNPTLEGEATATYLAKKIEPFGIKITRLARGLPSGSDLEYADTVTLERALSGRQMF